MGSSTVFPISEAVAEEFQKSTRGAMRATVGISGTGGGFKKFCRGETDIQDASRPISGDEMEECRKPGIQYFELLIAFDAMTVVSSPKNTWLQSIKLPELKRMSEPSAQGKIIRWKQINPAWPDEPLKLFGAGSDLDAFVNADAGLARKVCADDDFLDDLTQQLFRELLSFMLENAKTITRAIRLTFIGKYIERIADHAMNVVVYLAEGTINRHTVASDSSSPDA